MATFLSAHGYDPGPSQRPFSAGAISGVLATAPAVGVLFAFGSLHVETAILGLPLVATLGLGWLAMAIAGAIYARVFGRAANSVHGGWLFGMAFGFALWAAGAVLVLPIASGGVADRVRGRIVLAVGGWPRRRARSHSPERRDASCSRPGGGCGDEATRRSHPRATRRG